MGRVICADFETCDDRQLTGALPTKVRVWAWAACDVDTLETVYGSGISTFIEYMACTKATFYFHNLAFDGTHIIDYLLRVAGFKYVEDKKDLEPGTFTALISDAGKFYSLNVMFERNAVEVRDSLKKLPFSIKRLAQTFGLPEGKGEIDYVTWRAPGYEPDAEELDYIRRDVEIAARSLKTQLDQGYTKLTIGSDCMAFYKEQAGGNFKRWFPVLNPIQDKQIRHAYRGGYVRVEPRYRGVDVGPGISVDHNSMYPSRMLLDTFPYGRPKYFSGEYQANSEYPLYVQTLTCMFHVKPNGFPTVQLKNAGWLPVHEYAEEAPEPVTITLADPDIRLFFENYAVDVLSFDGGYMFHAQKGMFREYIEYWRKIKEVSQGGLRQLAKLFLRSTTCTGSSAQTPIARARCARSRTACSGSSRGRARSATRCTCRWPCSPQPTRASACSRRRRPTARGLSTATRTACTCLARSRRRASPWTITDSAAGRWRVSSHGRATRGRSATYGI